MKRLRSLMLTAGFLGCAQWVEADVLELKNGTTQFFQLENQINAALDVRLTAALPLIK